MILLIHSEQIVPKSVEKKVDVIIICKQNLFEIVKNNFGNIGITTSLQDALKAATPKRG